ncbi:MAG: DUF1080 domain-containing protein [Kiritimatiellae bacterium]|nr:DUF1080 domain-containing protein [Kiritimatiellia bacterium]
MLKLLPCFVLACACFVAADEMTVKAEPVRPAQKTALFNGKDLAGWTKVITAEPGSCPDTTWSVADGMIRCTGKPFGYLMTQTSYADYKLCVEYRWYGRTEQMNSGIFVHKNGPDNFFLPKAIEAQLKEDNAGDFVLLSQATLNGLENPKNLRVEKKAASSEKPFGEWNKAEVIVKGTAIDVRVNGVLQNQGTGAYADSGNICLQSEGGPIEFRNITVEPLH